MWHYLLRIAEMIKILEGPMKTVLDPMKLVVLLTDPLPMRRILEKYSEKLSNIIANSVP